VEEAKRVFEEIEDEDEYERIQDMRRNDDFIVDDDGYGYRDHGGEIWEQDDEEDGQGGKKKTNKKRKLDVSDNQPLKMPRPTNSTSQTS
jgi:hypothetical protein